MAKAKKPAGSASKSTKSAAGKSSSAASKAGKAASAKASAAADTAKAEVSKVVTPSALKKDVVAADKPMPAVAKEPKEADVTKPAPKAETPKTEAPASVATKAPAPVSAAPSEDSGSLFWPLVLGGVVAGVIGYGVSELNLLNTRTQDDRLANDIAALDDKSTTQAERLSALEAAEPETVDLSGITDQITALSTQLTDIDARLTAVENQPLTNGGTVGEVAAYERALNDLKSSVEAQKAEIQGLLNNALSVEEATAEAARKSAVQASLTEITTAIGTGQPFGDAVTALSDNGVADVPAGLADSAESGVVTLANLQGRFADDARTALSAARGSGEAEPEAGFGGFLKRQLGARSVAPREGSDPDAVLSRAEAAVRDGQLDTALTEIDALPDAAQTAMQSWLDDARARAAAQAAVLDLSNSLTAN